MLMLIPWYSLPDIRTSAYTCVDTFSFQSQTVPAKPSENHAEWLTKYCRWYRALEERESARGKTCLSYFRNTWDPTVVNRSKAYMNWNERERQIERIRLIFAGSVLKELQFVRRILIT